MYVPQLEQSMKQKSKIKILAMPNMYPVKVFIVTTE